MPITVRSKSDKAYEATQFTAQQAEAHALDRRNPLPPGVRLTSATIGPPPERTVQRMQFAVTEGIRQRVSPGDWVLYRPGHNVLVVPDEVLWERWEVDAATSLAHALENVLREAERPGGTRTPAEWDALYGTIRAARVALDAFRGM